MLSAQTAASLGVGASYVEYEGFLASGAATLTPAFKFDTRDLSLGAQGSWTIFESGNQVFQATTAAGWLVPSTKPWRLELSGAAGISKYASEPGSGHMLARSRLHFLGTNEGGWLSATAGATLNGDTDAPLELALGLWSVRGGFALVGTFIGTWLGNNRHVDIAGAARWTLDRVELEVRAGTRPWAESGGDPGDPLTGAWGEVSALVPLNAHIALALSGGTYPSDPVRRVLGADYFTAGLQLALFGEHRPSPLTIPAATVTENLQRTHSVNSLSARIEIVPSAQLHAVRVHVTGAMAVELMGDFTDWQATALTKVDENVWQILLPLERGVHRLNIRINGGEWQVPVGLRTEEDEFGGVVGIVVIN